MVRRREEAAQCVSHKRRQCERHKQANKQFEPAGSRTAVEQERSGRREEVPAVRQRAVFHVVEDEIVVFSQACEIFSRVVDHVVCTERPDHLHVESNKGDLLDGIQARSAARRLETGIELEYERRFKQISSVNTER